MPWLVQGLYSDEVADNDNKAFLSYLQCKLGFSSSKFFADANNKQSIVCRNAQTWRNNEKHNFSKS